MAAAAAVLSLGRLAVPHRLELLADCVELKPVLLALKLELSDRGLAADQLVPELLCAA